ncbi:hypothetical protein C8Q70DRAFT_654068 [Cubamyces menziesii]|nr:hypothetical protein C8Q70DRAFT_654068 [Cubamyces menziesii]
MSISLRLQKRSLIIVSLQLILAVYTRSATSRLASRTTTTAASVLPTLPPQSSCVIVNCPQLSVIPSCITQWECLCTTYRLALYQCLPFAENCSKSDAARIEAEVDFICDTLAALNETQSVRPSVVPEVTQRASSTSSHIPSSEPFNASLTTMPSHTSSPLHTSSTSHTSSPSQNPVSSHTHTPASTLMPSEHTVFTAPHISTLTLSISRNPIPTTLPQPTPSLCSTLAFRSRGLPKVTIVAISIVSGLGSAAVAYGVTLWYFRWRRRSSKSRLTSGVISPFMLNEIPRRRSVSSRGRHTLRTTRTNGTRTSRSRSSALEVLSVLGHNGSVTSISSARFDIDIDQPSATHPLPSTQAQNHSAGAPHHNTHLFTYSSFSPSPVGEQPGLGPGYIEVGPQRLGEVVVRLPRNSIGRPPAYSDIFGHHHERLILPVTGR